LSGVNTYTGGTLVNGTTLVVSNNSSVGTGAVTLNNAIFQADGLSNLTFANNFRLTGANLIDANGTTLTIAGGIAGAGSVEFANGGGGLVQRPRNSGAARRQQLHRRHAHLCLHRAAAGRWDAHRLHRRRDRQRRNGGRRQRESVGGHVDPE
jgi:hypothetical protein